MTSRSRPGGSFAARTCIALARAATVIPTIVGAGNLCHQAVFMNHAACAVTPLDPELIEVGDVIG
jgi:hypothetical protein